MCELFTILAFHSRDDKSRGWSVGDFSLSSSGETLLLARFTSATQHTGKNLDAAQTVVVCWDGICDPGRICICVDDANGGNIVQSALVQQNVIFKRVHADNKVWS